MSHATEVWVARLEPWRWSLPFLSRSPPHQRLSWLIWLIWLSTLPFPSVPEKRVAVFVGISADYSSLFSTPSPAGFQASCLLGVTDPRTGPSYILGQQVSPGIVPGKPGHRLTLPRWLMPTSLTGKKKMNGHLGTVSGRIQVKLAAVLCALLRCVTT